MRKLLIVLLSAGMLTACNGPEPVTPKEPNNSYIYADAETAIVWVGAVKSENSVMFYLSADVVGAPAEIHRGVFFSVANDKLGAETTISDFQFIDNNEGISFGQVNIVEGTVTAFLTGTNANVVLNATLTNGKTLKLKYVGSATVETITEPPVEPGRELNREWLFNSDTTKIVRATLGRYYHASGKFDDYRIILNASTPSDAKNPQSTQTGGMVQIYVPRNQDGITIDLSQKSAVADLWEITFFTKTGVKYLGDQEGATRNDVVSGTMKVTYYPDDVLHRVVITLDCTFKDGKTFKVRYDGGSWDLDDKRIEDPVPPSEGEGSFVYAQHSATPVTIGWAGYLYHPTKHSYAIALCEKTAKNYGRIWQTTDNAVMINIPDELLGQTIDLSVTHSVSGRDVWGFAFNDYDRNDINFEGYEDPTAHASYGIGENIKSGTLKVDKNGDVFTITFNVTTKTNLTLVGNYTGTMADLTNFGTTSTPFNGVFWWQSLPQQ